VTLARKKVKKKKSAKISKFVLVSYRRKNDSSQMLLGGGVSQRTHMHAHQRAPYFCQVDLATTVFSKPTRPLSSQKQKKRQAIASCGWSDVAAFRVASLTTKRASGKSLSLEKPRLVCGTDATLDWKPSTCTNTLVKIPS